MKAINSFDDINDSSTSGFVADVVLEHTSDITNISVLHESSLNFVAKGMRYGKWWILKGLNANVVGDQGLRHMLLKEYDIMRSLDHENIVKAVSFEDITGYGPCIVAEYVEGEPLSRWTDCSHSLEQRFSVAMQILKAVGYMHSRDIVHRDIKPDNILVSRLGYSVRIIDFGLSDSDSYAIFKQPAGTIDYVSPEQRRSNVPDIRNDIYSLGIVLRKLLPEHRFHSTLCRCVKSADKRPPNVDIIIKDLNEDLRRYKLLKLLTWTVAVVLVLIISIMYFAFGVNKEKYMDGDVDVAQQNIKVAHRDTATNVVNVADEKSLETPVNETVADNGANQLGRLIAQGCLDIDAAWQSTAMKYLDTVSDQANAWTDWSTRVMELEKENYLESIAANCSAATIEQVRMALDHRIDQNYKSWKTRRFKMQSVP